MLAGATVIWRLTGAGESAPRSLTWMAYWCSLLVENLSFYGFMDFSIRLPEPVHNVVPGFPKREWDRSSDCYNLASEITLHYFYMLLVTQVSPLQHGTRYEVPGRENHHEGCFRRWLLWVYFLFYFFSISDIGDTISPLSLTISSICNFTWLFWKENVNIKNSLY